jgi:hypothetical protein
VEVAIAQIRVSAPAAAAAKLLRDYATQVEALRRLRNGGSQFVRVEHVPVKEGVQGVIGNVGVRLEVTIWMLKKSEGNQQFMMV